LIHSKNTEILIYLQNHLLRKHTSVIPSKYPDSIKNDLRINWQKIHYPILIHLPIPFILKSIQKFANESSKAIMIVPKWKGQIWSALVEKFTMSRMAIKNAKNMLIARKNMGKKNMFLLPGQLKAPLLLNISNMK
jgi:hypothetical protein